MPGQASRHITVADLKTDHIGPSLDAVIDDINQAQKELPEKERTNKNSLDALAASKRKLDLSEETGNKLKKRGIQLMTDLQKVNKEKKEHEVAEAKVKEEFDSARRKSSDSQKEVDIWTRKLTSAQKAKRILKTGREEIAELQASIQASGRAWMAKDVTRAGNRVLNYFDDKKQEGTIDDTKLKEYETEVLQAKKVMGNALWELMLIQKEADKNGQTVTILKKSLIVKYLWNQGLTSNHPQCNQTLKSLCSATKNEEENTQQVATATYVCTLIMCKLDCIEDTTTEHLKFSQQAKDVAKGIIWN